MKALRTLLIHVATAGLWPAYVALLSYLVRVSPISRPLARSGSFAVNYLAVSLFIAALTRTLLRPSGWAEEALLVPSSVARQLRRLIWALVVAGVVFLMPDLLLMRGLIAPNDRPLQTIALCRALALGFEVSVFIVAVRLLRRSSPLLVWLFDGTDWGGWIGRHRRSLGWALLAAIVAVIGLDVQGYAFTAHRVSMAAGQAVLLAGACWGVYRLVAGAIDHHAWRWAKASVEAAEPPPDGSTRDTLAVRLRRLATLLVPIGGLIAGAWIWNFDLALFRYVGETALWGIGKDAQVTVGNAVQAVVILAVTIGAWHHLNDIFAVAVFPRMPEDPGLRYAVLTLCRYGVLGIGVLTGLSAVHLGLEKVGMVLAALGVGLGFGLQEIVSNFVSGLILLVERPIRVGDVVTVGGMTGRVDRINIRATTIINGDNQSMIVPNREFITANLVNWTHKDRIVRITANVHVAFGTDPDRVTELLLTIAHEDEEVLCNPVPNAAMESIGPSALSFVLHAFVADPSLGARVRHRLYRRIQDRFLEAGIEIPLPSNVLHLRTTHGDAAHTSRGETNRVDAAEPVPPSRHRQAIPEPAAESHRGVDE